MRRYALACTATMILFAAGQGRAAASSLVYDNGPINGATTAYTLCCGFATTDSFSVGSATTLDSATIGLWLLPGDTPTSVTWSIGTAAFGADVASGTSTLTNTFQYNNVFNYDIYSSMFAVSGTLAGSTTYWLTLTDATTTISVVDPSYVMFWDENSGPSTASHNLLGSIPSEAFTLNGSPSGDAPVPEPASLTLLGLGLAGMGARRWRQRKA